MNLISINTVPKNLNLRIEMELVTAGVDAAVWRTYVVYIYPAFVYRKYIFSRIKTYAQYAVLWHFLQPWQARLLCRDLVFLGGRFVKLYIMGNKMHIILPFCMLLVGILKMKELKVLGVVM